VALYIPTSYKLIQLRLIWNSTEDGQPIPETQLNVSIKFVYVEGSLSEQGNIDLNF